MKKLMGKRKGEIEKERKRKEGKEVEENRKK